MTVDQVANGQLVVRTGGGRLMRWRLPPTLVSLVVAGVAWEVAGRLGDATYFPPLSKVVSRLATMIANGQILPPLQNSLTNLAIGFTVSVLVGVSIGALMGIYSKVDMALDMYVYALLTAPMLVFAPIFFMMFGLSRIPIILVIVSYSVFIIIVNTRTAVRGVSRSLIEMSRSYCATDRQLFMTVILPASLPVTMAGIRLAMGRAVKGMLNGEMLIAVVGLGLLVVSAGYALDATTVLAVLLVIITVAMILIKIVQLVDLRLTSWLPPNAKVRGRR
jgi:ABC-type nitrate/sulfonate/bicarbonate transport system permease component